MTLARATAMTTTLAALTLVACETHTTPTPTPEQTSPSPSPAPSSWTDFYGIQYKAPAGTNAEVTRSVLPGPGGLGGSPTDERPYVSLAMAGAHGFYLQITKSRDRETLDGMKAIYIANNIGTNHVGVPTRDGWELTYDTKRSDDPTKASKARLIYVDLAGGHYECIYDEQNCPDPAAAETICRSMRAKP